MAPLPAPLETPTDWTSLVQQSPTVIKLFPGSDDTTPVTSAPEPREIDISFELDIPLSVRETEAKLIAHGVVYDKHGLYHLKIRHVNYYPTTGAVMLDGQPKFKTKGFDFLIQVLRREGILRG